MVIVGSSTIVGKLVIASFPINVALGLRFALALAILVPLLLRLERGLPRLAPRDGLVLLLQAIAGVLLLNVLTLQGLRFTSAAEGGIIRSTLPAFTALVAFVLLRERPARTKVFGIGLIVLGILSINALAAASAGERGSDPLLGNLLVLLAVISEGFFTPLGKLATKGVTPLAISTFLSLFGVVVFLPLAALEASSFDAAAVSLTGWLALVYYAVAVTVLAFFLWFRGVSLVPASTAAGFMGLLPISAVLLSYAVLGEAFAWSHVVGTACILGGIALLTRTPAETQA